MNIEFTVDIADMVANESPTFRRLLVSRLAEISQEPKATVNLQQFYDTAIRFADGGRSKIIAIKEVRLLAQKVLAPDDVLNTLKGAKDFVEKIYPHSC